jgi:hypothetical protein
MLKKRESGWPLSDIGSKEIKKKKRKQQKNNYIHINTPETHLMPGVSGHFSPKGLYIFV